MKKIMRSFLLLTILFLGLIGSKYVSASELRFSVNPKLPTNQIDSKVGYYNLLLSPGEKQVLKVELSNQTDKKVNVSIAIANATTNINGVVEYIPNKIKPDSSLKYSLKDHAKAPSKVEIPAKSTKDVEIEVTMPNSKFDGLVAGGITFKEESDSKEKEKSDSNSISIQNKYQFVVGLLMQQTKNIVSPVLNLNNVTPAQVNYRNVINANFQNSARGYLRDMAIDAKVTEQGKNDVLYKIQKENMSMAPNSNFDFPTPLEGQRFQPGDYTYNAEVYGVKDSKGKYVFGKDDKGNPQRYAYRWKFSENFTITGSKAADLNEKDVTVKADNSWIYWLVIAVLLILLSLFIFFILWKRRKKKDDDDNEAQEEVE